MIDKYPHEYSVMDEYGYTDADIVKKLNEVVEVLNKLLEVVKESEKNEM